MPKEGETSFYPTYSFLELTIKDSKNTINMLLPHAEDVMAITPACLGVQSFQSKSRVSLVSCTFFVPFMKHYLLGEKMLLIKEYGF